ncbi:XrtA system polysaccharide chain length determinant [Rhodovibrio salinarum]|nr:XrtA system polysaccharide chain length determinant [Rhodovibrio salinarum]
MQDILDQIYQYLDAVWQRRWIAFGAAVGLSLVGWAAVATLPNTYEARTKIFVDTASVLNPLLRGVAVENDVDHQLAVMRETLLARPNLAEVVRQTDMDLTAETPAELEAVINSLGKRIRVDSTKTNIFTLAYTDTQQKRSYEVVQSLMTMFVQNNLGRNREDMDSAQAFLDRQIAEYENKLDTAEHTLAVFKQQNMTLLPGQSGLQDQLSSAQSELALRRSQLNDAIAREKLLTEELAGTPQTLTQQVGGFGSGPPTGVEARIMALRGRLEELRSRYTDQHPDVQAAQRQMEGLQQELDAQARQVAGPGGEAPLTPGGIQTPNPTYSELRVRLVDTRATVETLRRQVTDAAAKVEQITSRLEQVPEVEAQLQKLKRDYDVMKHKYEELLTRRESAQISSDREQQGDRVQFRIIEPPQIPTIAAGPPRSLFMTAVLVVSVGVGVGLTILLGFFRTTYATSSHLRRDFDLPVIGVVTKLRDRRYAVRRLISNLGLCVALVGFLGLFGALQLVEAKVGLGNLTQSQMTPAALKNVLASTVDGVQSGTIGASSE